MRPVGSYVLDRKGPSWWMVTWISAASVLMCFFSPNPGLMLTGMLIFIFFLRRFFDQSIPPVLLYNFVLQWLFFQAQLFDGMVRDVNLTDLDFISTTKPTTTYLGLIAVFAYFLGMHLVTRKIPRYSTNQFLDFLRRLNLERLFVVYSIAYIVLLFFGGLIWIIPALTQPLFVLTEFRWAIFFLLFSGCFAQDRLKGLLLGFIMLDVALSLFSFFAAFREVITFSFIAYWVFHFRSSQFRRVMVVPAIVLVVLLGSAWSSIKEDYRDFLNKGTGAPAVLVSRTEAYDKLAELLDAMDSESLLLGFEILVDRISWIGAFDAVYNYVPAVRPHEDGKLWLTGIKRAVMPRAFFPDKAALADSKELNYYSGLGVDEKDTSISLSAIAASYIDFGPVWMHLPLFLFGALCGWIFRKAVEWGRYPPIGFALTMPVIFMVQISDNSINKLLPHFVLYLACLWGIRKVILRPFLDFIIINPRRIDIQQPQVKLGNV
jgi:hypothetical protein